MAGEFAVFSDEGDVEGWLAETGWQGLGVQPLGGPGALIVAEAI